MSRVRVTGSNDRIGAETARSLAAQGHEVIRHARSAERADGSQFRGGRTVVVAVDARNGSPFQVNALAPLLLTSLLPKPRRIVVVGSDSISRGKIRLDDLQHEQGWTADAAHADFPISC